MGIADELMQQNFGAGLADALTKIGLSVKQARDEQQAQQVTGDLMKNVSGVSDLLSPEFMQRYTTAIGQLGTSAVGQKVIGSLESAMRPLLTAYTAQENTKVRQMSEKTDYQNSVLAPIQKAFETYLTGQQSGNVEPDVAESAYKGIKSAIETARKDPNIDKNRLSTLDSAIFPPSKTLGTAAMQKQQMLKSQMAYIDSKKAYEVARTSHQLQINDSIKQIDLSVKTKNYAQAASLLSNAKSTIMARKVDAMKGLVAATMFSPQDVPQWQAEINTYDVQLNALVTKENEIMGLDYQNRVPGGLRDSYEDTSGNQATKPGSTNIDPLLKLKEMYTPKP